MTLSPAGTKTGADRTRRAPIATLWLINQYAATPEQGFGIRHHTFARLLAAKGHRVHLIAASRHHLLREPDAPAPAREERDGYVLHRLPVPRYPHAHHPRRVAAWLAFRRGLAGLDRLIPDRPDAILYSSPSLLGYPAAERLARRAGARLAFEVRDIWPLTLRELGGFSARHPLIAWMQRIEDRAYARADVVVSNLPHAVEHMASRGMDAAKFRWLPNGFLQEEFADPEPLQPALASSLPDVDECVTVGYAGTFSAANDLQNLLGAAARLRGRADIRFVLVGRGAREGALRADLASADLGNVVIHGAVPKAQVPALLERFDVCYFGLKESPLYRYGIAPNKLPYYLMAARPVAFAVDAGPYRPVEDAGAGLTVPPSDPAALAAAIADLADRTPAERAAMGARGRAYALEHHDYARIADRLEAVLLPAASGRVAA